MSNPERIRSEVTIFDACMAVGTVAFFAALSAAVLWIMRVPITFDAIRWGVVCSACWVAFVNQARDVRVAHQRSERAADDK
jgi:hypothetical protein